MKEFTQFVLLCLANKTDANKCLLEIFIPNNYANYQDVLKNMLNEKDFIKYNMQITLAEAFTVHDYDEMNKTYKLPTPKFMLDRYQIVMLIQVRHNSRFFYGEDSKTISFTEDFCGDIISKIRQIALKTLQQFATQEKVIYT